MRNRINDEEEIEEKPTEETESDEESTEYEYPTRKEFDDWIR